MPRLANDCLSQVERGALEEQLRCDNCVMGKTEDWGPWYGLADCEAATAAHVAQMLP